MLAGTVLVGCTSGSGSGAGDETGGTAGAPTGAGTGSGGGATAGSGAGGSGAGASGGQATPAAGCPAAGGGVPAGAAQLTTIDLDGDGRPDVLWIASDGADRSVGFTTASGATSSLPVTLAGPQGATAFALRPAPQDAADVLVSDGRVADLLTVQDCALVPVTDAGGQPWRFDLGFGDYGTGVGCLDLDGDGRTDLVGLNARSQDDGDSYLITRTVIDVAGTVARAGAGDELHATRGTDDAAIETAHQITCGDRTADADGVHEPQG
ncbi:hypothetical protein AGMMS50218_11200 [Actinomycetota bacterium]|nr:hypothetical protein AGMMS50218_11200 [Actinomycetota bacterium]